MRKTQTLLKFCLFSVACRRAASLSCCSLISLSITVSTRGGLEPGVTGTLLEVSVLDSGSPCANSGKTTCDCGDLDLSALWPTETAAADFFGTTSTTLTGGGTFPIGIFLWFSASSQEPFSLSSVYLCNCCFSSSSRSCANLISLSMALSYSGEFLWRSCVRIFVSLWPPPRPESQLLLEVIPDGLKGTSSVVSAAFRSHIDFVEAKSAIESVSTWLLKSLMSLIVLDFLTVSDWRGKIETSPVAILSSQWRTILSWSAMERESTSPEERNNDQMIKSRV